LQELAHPGTVGWVKDPKSEDAGGCPADSRTDDDAAGTGQTGDETDAAAQDEQEEPSRPRDLGSFIRDLRNNAQISLRQLAKQAGVSNPYLSQIERGLRKPSAEVLAQLAAALRVSTPVMYLRAGLLEAVDGHGVPAAIAADPELTLSQKQTLTQIYESFRSENARGANSPEDQRSRNVHQTDQTDS
jgi:transcriptional regulator with XRE-family HTH domain